MWDGLLPIGSVVLLEDSEKRLMVIGYAQTMPGDETKVFDYCGCLFPEGFIDATTLFLFNQGQIDKIYSVGYMDQEQFETSETVLKALADYRSNLDAQIE